METKLWVLDMMFYRFYPIWFSSFYDQSRIPDWPKTWGSRPTRVVIVTPIPKVWGQWFEAIPYAATPKHTTASKIYGEPSIFTLNPGAPRLLGGMSLQGSGLPPAYHGSAGCQSPLWQKKTVDKGTTSKTEIDTCVFGGLRFSWIFDLY